MTQQQDISFDVDEIERQPLDTELERLLEDPSVDLALSIAEKVLGRESLKLREFALECKKEVKGETKADRKCRLRWKRGELFG